MIIDYEPINGFADLRDFELSKREFNSAYNIQKYLKSVEDKKEHIKKYSPLNWQKAQELSADLQMFLLGRERRNQTDTN